MKVRNEFDPLFFTPPCDTLTRRRRLYKGDGGGTYYANAERLYGSQADAADFMLSLGKQYLPGAVSQYEGATKRYFDPNYEAEQVGKAVTASNTAQANATAGLKRDLARYGLNPASGRFGNMMNRNAIDGAAMTASAANKTSQAIQDKQFGVSKDFYSNLVGMPSDSAATAGQAASGFAQMGANKQAADDREAAGWGQAVGLGGSLFFKDGGEVRKAGVKMARGGLLPRETMPLPQQPTPQPSGGAGAGVAQGASTGLKIKDAMSGAASDKMLGGMSKGLATVADVTGNAGLAETALGAAGAGAEQAGILVAQNAGIPGATAATAEALGAGTAIASEAASAASPLLSSISTVVPWLGAAAAVGSILGFFSEGGDVRRKDMTGGGEVDGPGTATSDDVPAWLSDGEYVLNAEAVKMVGKDKLDRINDAGLKKRGVTRKPIQRAADGGYELSLGSFVGGMASGYMTGENLKERREDRKYRQDEREYNRRRMKREEDRELRREQLGKDYGDAYGAAHAAASESGKSVTADTGLEPMQAQASAAQPNQAQEAAKGLTIIEPSEPHMAGKPLGHFTKPVQAETFGLGAAPQIEQTPLHGPGEMTEQEQDAIWNKNATVQPDVTANGQAVPIPVLQAIGPTAKPIGLPPTGKVEPPEPKRIGMAPAKAPETAKRADLVKPRMDADYLFYTSMWPKLRPRYAQEYGIDKAMDMDDRLREAAAKNHRRRLLEAAQLEASGNKSGVVAKFNEIYNRDLPDGNFSNATLRSDGQVDMVIFDTKGNILRKETMPYPDMLALAKADIGTEMQRLEGVVNAQTNTRTKAYHQELGGAKTEQEVQGIAAKYGLDPIKAMDDFLKIDETRSKIEKNRAEAEDKRANSANGGVKLTPAQQANNAEIDRARRRVDGMTREQVMRKIQSKDNTGLDNPYYDPTFVRDYNLAQQRKVGADPHFDSWAAREKPANTLESLPPGAKDTGRTKGGKPVYQLPDGRYFVQQ